MSSQSPETMIYCKDDSKSKSDQAVISFFRENWKAMITEFVSTMILLLFGCMGTIPITGQSSNPPMYAPFTFGLTVLLCVQTFGHISGAHMNPSVTLVAVMRGLTSIPLGIFYVVLQLLGAILGYGILTTLSPLDLSADAVCVTLPHPNFTTLQALGVEAALTSCLSLMCCAAWDPVNHHRQDSMPLKFGMVIAGLSLAGGPLTGASMNPARSLGPALWVSRWDIHWVYWVGPLVGATLGVLIYMVVEKECHRKE